MSANQSLHADIDIDFLHDISSRMAAADPLHEVLAQIVEFASALVKCDSCFVYVLEGEELVLRASKNPHAEVVDRLKLKLGQGITGWVAEHKEPPVIPKRAGSDRASNCSMNCPKTGLKPPFLFLLSAAAV